MPFNTEKNKLGKLWNKVKTNTNEIIKQESDNSFIIQNINELNRRDNVFYNLKNFGTDWITPSILRDDEDNIIGNQAEFRLKFTNVPVNFIPFIHAEVLYRFGTSGIIPLEDGIPFDEDIGTSNALQKSEMFQFTNDNTVEYLTYIRMDFSNITPVEIQYKFICYLSNSHYYQTF